MTQPARRPLHYALALALVIAAGLASRSSVAVDLPAFVKTYAGDTLWALALFLFLGLLFPKQRTTAVALLAVAVAFGVEFSQLYHAPWIDHLRATRLGGLLLGFGFLWSDLLCYSTGILLGVAGEWTLRSRTRGK
jgi:hypothetical protein